MDRIRHVLTIPGLQFLNYSTAPLERDPDPSLRQHEQHAPYAEIGKSKFLIRPPAAAMCDGAPSLAHDFAVLVAAARPCVAHKIRGGGRQPAAAPAMLRRCRDG
ncbi:ATP-dependent RNA helicase [Dorcoceras hygrometricum]|uniref:ATP-dependent RNA helicase n=1 Tax=Dorcoceras hygrometricum TaxID=472368 RepID=A0A2Z7BMQ8_9LAMI|nr:ATP-dependent RNA helicase [Dorcoceras hygrometricum]